MNKNIESLILETVGEVLLEGRLEDVKSKYPDNDPLIDRLSQSDPSGNNKYLEWMTKMALGQGTDEGIPTSDKIVDVVTRFHSNMARINNNMSSEIVSNNPDLYPGRETRRVSNNPKDINSYSSINGLEKVVIEAEENAPNRDDRNKLYQDQNWTVIVPKTHDASCKYGRHSAWCVSTSNDRWYNNYTSNGMLAFVLWRKKTEGMQREGEYKVAAYIKYENPDYKNWEWYNKQDNRMDNDLPLAVFPPELIQSIKDHVQVHMRTSGYLKDIDEAELEEKTHLLNISGDEDKKVYTFVPKPEVDSSWLEKYDTRRHNTNLWNNVDWTQVIPIIQLREPLGKMNGYQIDLTRLYRNLKNVGRWYRNRTPLMIFQENLGYGIRGLLSDQKTMELYNFTKEHFRNNFKGYMDVQSTDLAIGDYVRWERRTRADRRSHGRWRQGEIIRQTPSGYMVVNVEGEDKPARFKPSYSKWMGKRYEPENLDMSIWDNPDRPVSERPEYQQ
jgi:hypothetical protein